MIPLDELKKMQSKELKEELEKVRTNLLKLRLALASRQSKETSEVKKMRRYAARIKTLQRLMEFEQIKENPRLR